MTNKEGLANRGAVITILYTARNKQGTNTPPPPTTPSLYLLNHNEQLQGIPLEVSNFLQEVAEKEIKNLITAHLLTTADSEALTNKIHLHYLKGCDNI
jgi:hypothetical protein